MCSSASGHAAFANAAPRRAQRGLNRGRVVTEVRRQGQINLHRDYEDGSIHDQSQEHRVNRALRRGAAAGCAAAFITRARHLYGETRMGNS